MHARLTALSCEQRAHARAHTRPAASGRFFGPPDEGEEIVVKVSDFGLSRDKGFDSANQTVRMTGAGSALWMAPEILLGEKYNQSVDVFSCVAKLFASCAV